MHHGQVKQQITQLRHLREAKGGSVCRLLPAVQRTPWRPTNNKNMADKDAYWFRHDSNASRGLRILQIKQIHGFWGLGVYWSVIEILREQEDYQYSNDTNSLQLLCSLIGCQDEAKFLSWYRDCVRVKLFEEKKNSFFSEGLSKSMVKWTTSKRNGSQGGRPQKKPNHNLNHNPPLSFGLNPNHNPQDSTVQEKRLEEIREEKGRVREIYDELRKVESLPTESIVSLYTELWMETDPKALKELLEALKMEANELRTQIKIFLKDKIAAGEIEEAPKDIRRHFFNLMKKRLKAEDEDDDKPEVFDMSKYPKTLPPLWDPTKKTKP